MEYHVDGTLTVEVTDDVVTDITLVRDTLPVEGYPWIAASSDVVRDIITDVCRFSAIDNYVTGEGVRVICAEKSGAWCNDTAPALRWLCGHGAVISSQFVGQDGEAWVCDGIGIGDRQFDQHSLTYMIDVQRDAFARTKTALNNTDLSALDPPDDFRVALEAIEAAPPITRYA